MAWAKGGGGGHGGGSWGFVSTDMGIHAYGKYARAWGHVDV